MIEIPHLQKDQKLYGAQERLHITSMLGGTHALKTYVFRVRYRANNGAWWTDYSEWSNSICMPDRSLLTLLENCDKTRCIGNDAVVFFFWYKWCCFSR